MKPQARRQSPARAFSTIEAVVVMLALAVAIPPAVDMLADSADRQSDSVASILAATLASAVLETVIADVMSDDPGLGYNALADPATYLDAPTTGLRSRMIVVAQPYEARGLSWDLAIGEQVGPDGVVTGNPQLDVHRVVTVTVTIPQSRGGSLDLPVSVMVAEVLP